MNLKKLFTCNNHVNDIVTMKAEILSVHQEPMLMQTAVMSNKSSTSLPTNDFNNYTMLVRTHDSVERVIKGHRRAYQLVTEPTSGDTSVRASKSYKSLRSPYKAWIVGESVYVTVNQKTGESYLGSRFA